MFEAPTAFPFGLFLSHHYLGPGMGGTERIAAFRLLMWTLAFGARGLFPYPVADGLTAHLRS
ncbi:hypothetical protein SVIO_067500 [Streptomyces violaceusniger]|uniref:Uncharacterized protein n=1 Tax=Streptomyces violaceusniger TaxID=68280 RepID=A0A4D4LC35_STRVO|nr:hypothetical protein SVIO_067500 [Streptomyces violaceusniger]